MPTYQYSCTECDHFFEIVQSFADDSLTVCPECEGRLRKVFNAVGVVFKGSGFYRTDSRAQQDGSKQDGQKQDGSKDGAAKDGAAKDGANKDGAAKKSESTSSTGSGSTDGASSSSSSSTTPSRAASSA